MKNNFNSLRFLFLTSVAFGGPNLSELFVTTAGANVTAASVGIFPGNNQYDSAGHLFKVTELGAKGFPGVKVRV